jgi:hypothetical protein
MLCIKTDLDYGDPLETKKRGEGAKREAAECDTEDNLWRNVV